LEPAVLRAKGKGGGESKTDNLVVRRAGIIPPRRLAHHPPRHGLKVHEVVALLQQRHLLDALLPLLLLRVRLRGFLQDGGHVDGAEVLGLVEVLLERVGWVDWLELFRGIFPGVLEYDLLATRVLRQEVRDVVGAAVHDDPAVFCAVVLGYFYTC
jgi:hypothetical protein